MELAEKLKHTVCSEVDKRLVELNDISENIWKNPELCFEETYAHDLLTDILEKEGFLVSRKTPIPTAFTAVYKNGDGIKAGIVVEYDALPGIGHACGHNLISEAGIGAALGNFLPYRNCPALIFNRFFSPVLRLVFFIKDLITFLSKNSIVIYSNHILFVCMSFF